MNKIPVILLAAGGSVRMGQPKQLIPWREKTLIEHQVETLINVGNPVIVVLGNASESVIPLLEKYDIGISINKNWETGLGSSVVSGINYVVEKYPDTEGVMTALLDLPFISVQHYQNLLKNFQPGTGQIIISTSAYGWKGVPAVFDRCYFDELKALKGDEGAKNIIRKYINKTIGIDCGVMLKDLDTPEDFRKLTE
jgi:molybdenum cofactor cytidylyltransferase